MNSCLYSGFVSHRRSSPVANRFRYPLYMLYLDLAEFDRISRECSLVSSRRFAPFCVRGVDHPQLRDGARSSSASNEVSGNAEEWANRIRQLVERRLSISVPGNVCLLTFPRNWGYYFAPLNLYYCFQDGNRSLRAIVAEVSNTPWLETHYYVLDCQQNAVRSGYRNQQAKQFHVSPFLPIEGNYNWRWNDPGETLRITIETSCIDPPFVARMWMRRQVLNNQTLLRLLRQNPWQSGSVSTLIYWQALRLWMKKCPYFPHPRNQASSPTP
ncbi:MAG: DUF1365 domain-containing protein [Planctomycetota bacterium]|nr:DUF1365 domain-containing protein [Planctomycetota bacterium]MDA1177858.1 DUF1365 domain-containing protein [Planctomycetota bacterium]